MTGVIDCLFLAALCSSQVVFPSQPHLQETRLPLFPILRDCYGFPPACPATVWMAEVLRPESDTPHVLLYALENAVTTLGGLMVPKALATPATELGLARALVLAQTHTQISTDSLVQGETVQTHRHTHRQACRWYAHILMAVRRHAHRHFHCEKQVSQLCPLLVV